jgi:hypothetical protein
METIDCEMNATFFPIDLFLINNEFFLEFFNFQSPKVKKCIPCIFGFQFLAINIEG